MTDPILTVATFTRLLEAEVQRHLGDANLTLSRYTTLTRADGATVATLAQQTGVSQQVASKTVRDLRLLGYVDPARTHLGSHDRRQRLLKITDRGRAALDSASSLTLPAALLAAMDGYVQAATQPLPT